MIRLAQKEDCQNLAALSIQVWLHTYATEGVGSESSNYVMTRFTEKYYAGLLEKSNYKIFVYVEKTNLLGFIVVNLESFFESEANGFEICTFYVQEHFQNQGIGKSLLNIIKETYGDVFWLSTWIHNKAAITFYKKCGFKHIGSRYVKLYDESHENIVLSYNCA